MLKSKDESDSVDPSEFILRRVPYNQLNNYINIALPQPVTELAFMPLDYDENGISVNREYFVSADSLADIFRGNRNKECYIVRFKTKDILALEPPLSAIPAPVDESPGHALIPEINRIFYKKKKIECLELQNKLANLIKIEDIIHWPNE